MTDPDRDLAPEPGAALAALYEAEWPKLLRVAYVLTDSLPTAEEIVQDAFVRLQSARTPVANPGGQPRRLPAHHGGERLPRPPPPSCRGPTHPVADRRTGDRRARRTVRCLGRVAVAAAGGARVAFPRRPVRRRHRRRARLPPEHRAFDHPPSPRLPAKGTAITTLDLDDRMRKHYQQRTAELPTRGPGLDTRPTLVRARTESSTPSRLRMAVIGSAAAALILGLVAVAGVRSS